ncbi:hypothetical protein ACHAXR_004700 [Thalassiosira sp. AJA248-18]
MDIKSSSAGSSSPSSREQHPHDDVVMPSSSSNGISSAGQDKLPPITMASSPTTLQSHIADQSWDRVSARQPIGNLGEEPDRETFIEFASTILETRLADVVKHRRAVKLSSSSSPGSSRSRSPTTSDDWWLAEGEIMTCPLNDSVDFQGKQHGSATGKSASSSPPAVLLTSTCRSQIRAYVRRIASMYRTNRYHGLEHAVHVTMSANKLLDMLHEGNSADSDNDSADLNDFSVSEPHIKGLLSGSSCRGGSNGNMPLQNDSEHSDTSENGYKFPMGGRALTAAATTTTPTTQKSPDFDSRNHLSRPKKRSNSKQPRSSTYLIYSDMFTKFAFVFAAIIHDVDHQGVPNTRLVLENDPVVELHGGISAAEKHSIKVAFRTLSECNDFDEFRSVVFESPDDQLQMHRIVTNLVISTDIASPDRMQSTKMRWEQAFLHHHNHHQHSNSPSSGHHPLPFGRLSLAGQSPPRSSEIATVQASKPQLVPMQSNPDNTTSTMNHSRPPPSQQRRNSLKRVLQLNGGQTVEYFTECNDDDNGRHDARTALRHSVVIETMLNVADVAHSMQSWELFLFWNRKLFEELYVAFKEGRSDNDPSNDWYENQLGFYRLYVIPLAEKMKTCGVFGECGGEWVKNAVLIRDRWSDEGDQVTKDMIASVKSDVI